MPEQMMSIEEKRKLDVEAKERQATTQFKGGMPPVSAEASETDGHMSKEVARLEDLERIERWLEIGGIFWIPITRIRLFLALI